MEPRDVPGTVLEEGEETHHEVDVDQDRDDALELGVRPLHEGDHDDRGDEGEEEGAVMLMGDEERIHATTLRATAPDSSTGTLFVYRSSGKMPKKAHAASAAPVSWAAKASKSRGVECAK